MMLENFAHSCANCVTSKASKDVRAEEWAVQKAQKKKFDVAKMKLLNVDVDVCNVWSHKVGVNWSACDNNCCHIAVLHQAVVPSREHSRRTEASRMVINSILNISILNDPVKLQVLNNKSQRLSTSQLYFASKPYTNLTTKFN